MPNRYFYDGKLYFINHTNIYNEIVKKIRKRANKLPDQKKRYFEEISKKISDSIRWSVLNNHLKEVVLYGSKFLINNNIYTFFSRVNELIRKAECFIRRNNNIETSIIERFSDNLKSLVRKIFSNLDENATCLSQNRKRKVVT